MLSAIVTVSVLTVVVVPLTVRFPDTTKLSSIVVVPPAESIVKFPVSVSISFAPVTPIRTLSISAPVKTAVADELFTQAVPFHRKN